MECSSGYVFRVLGARRAVCWVEGGGVVEVVEQTIPETSTTSTVAQASERRPPPLVGHLWAPKPVRFSGGMRWNAARGVLEVGRIVYEPPQ